MSLFEKISIQFAYSPYIFVLCVIILIAYTGFIYRSTLPKVNLLYKSILIFVRSAALLLTLILIFDPILKIFYEDRVEPQTLVFIDNSKSISEFGNSEDTTKLNSFSELYAELFPPNTSVYKFGSAHTKLKSDSELNYEDNSTSFEDAVKTIEDFDDVSSILLITDGIFNDGPNPERELIDLNIPIYSIGIGDTTTFNDISIEQISTNKVIYVNRETEIEVIIKNSGFGSIKSTVQLFTDNQLLESKNIELSANGINREKFNLTAEKVGQSNIRIEVLPINTEKNLLNNSKSSYITVLETKKKIMVIAGSPSRDLATILKSLSKFDDYEVNKVIELTETQLYNDESDFSTIKESDLLFFVGFPNKNSNDNLIFEVAEFLNTNNSPFFFALTSSTDISKLKIFEENLPFSIDKENSKLFSSQIIASPISNLLGSSNSQRNAWEELPPIDIPNSIISPNKNSQIIVEDKISNLPVVFTNESFSRRSITITASNFWRWKLQAPNKDLQLFDNFILNSVKWLSIENGKKRFFAEPNKKVFKLGEPTSFNASVFDETFEPVSNTKVNLELKNGSKIIERNFSSKGNAQYEIDVTLLNPGEWSYKASLENNLESIEPITGIIQIEPMELELIDRKMNKDLLESISKNTDGSYARLNAIENSIVALNYEYEEQIYYKNIDKELRLSNIEIILIIIVLLFSIEWIVRKWLRMM